MEPPPKRRRVLRQLHDLLETGPAGVAEPSLPSQDDFDIDNLMPEDRSPKSWAKDFLPSWSLPQSDQHPSTDRENQKGHHIHARHLKLYRDVGSVVGQAVQPAQTTVASLINVVLEQGGQSVGDVLVPAASSVFTVDGYGPVTLGQDAVPTANALPTDPGLVSNGPRPTSGPSPKNAAASQNATPPQNPMSIQVPGSSSQVILSSPPTPLPPSPSSSSSAASSSESYFGSSSNRSTGSTQTSSSSSITSSQTVPTTSSLSPQTINGGFIPTRGNFSTSFVTSSQTISGSTSVTTFPVIVTPSSNFTSTLSPSSLSETFPTTSNQTSTTPSLNSTLLTPSSAAAISSSFSSSTTLQSTTSSSASVSNTAEATNGLGGAGGPTATTDGIPASSSTVAAASGGGGSPSTPTLVGSVVGAVAGLALILLLLLFLLRRRKAALRQQQISRPNLQSASTGLGPGGTPMTERSSAAVPLAGAGFFRRLRPDSGATATTTETAPSERGFQNLGGRRLPRTLNSRDDGYGDIPFGAAGSSTASGPSSSRGPQPPSIPIVTAGQSNLPGHSSPESLSGSSFYRDSQGFYGGPGSGQARPEPASNSSSMFVGPASPPQSPTNVPPTISQPQEGIAVMRPGPARTPVTTQGGLSPFRGPPARGTPPPPHIPGTIQERPPQDGLGRSHPSMDGSRGSRFAEDI